MSFINLKCFSSHFFNIILNRNHLTYFFALVDKFKMQVNREINFLVIKLTAIKTKTTTKKEKNKINYIYL
jgi:hypothetical protein